MRKLFIKNLFILQGLNIVIKPLWLLVVDRIAQNNLGTAYSAYNLQLTTCLLFGIVLDIGIQNFNNTQVAADNGFFKQYFKAFVGLKCVLSLVYFLIIVAIGFQSGQSITLLLVLALNQILNSYTLYFRSNINGLHHFFIDSLLSISDKFFAIIICLAFYFFKQINILNFALAQTYAGIITVCIAGFLNIKYWKTLAFTSSLNNYKILDLLKKSLPYALLFMLMGFYTRADVQMMDWLLPKAKALENSGIYAHSFRLLDAACMFAMLFSGLLLPMFAKLIAEKNDVKPLAELGAKVLLIISIAVAIAANGFKDGIMQSLYTFNDIEGVIASANVFGNIMLCFIPMCMVYIFGTLLTAKGDIKMMNIAAIISLTVNIGLNIILIPQYESYGASISQLATQIVFSTICIVRCFYLFQFKITMPTVLKFGLFIISLFGIYVLVKGFQSVWISLLLFAIGSLLLVLLLRFFDVNKLKEFYQNKTQ